MTTIELDDEQAATLARIAHRQARSVSSLVGEAVQALIAAEPAEAAGWRSDPEMIAAFGAWKRLMIEDGVDYQRRLRSEWSDDRDE